MHDIPYARSFLSTPSARRATNGGAGSGRDVKISIHALCEEGDFWSPPLAFNAI